MKKIDSNILKIKEIISSSLNAEKIILFGSYAKGTNTEESDIDICIITEEKRRKLEMLRMLRRALFKFVAKPVDLLIYNHEEFEERAVGLKSIEREIKEQGISLYG